MTSTKPLNSSSHATGENAQGTVSRGFSEQTPGIEIISQHSNQIGGVKVTFTVGRLGKRS